MNHFSLSGHNRQIVFQFHKINGEYAECLSHLKRVLESGSECLFEIKKIQMKIRESHEVIIETGHRLARIIFFMNCYFIVIRPIHIATRYLLQFSRTSIDESNSCGFFCFCSRAWIGHDSMWSRNEVSTLSYDRNFFLFHVTQSSRSEKWQ